MENKLELKHLAMYKETGLELKHKKTGEVFEFYDIGKPKDGKAAIIIKSKGKRQRFKQGMLLPMLRPFSIFVENSENIENSDLRKEWNKGFHRKQIIDFHNGTIEIRDMHPISLAIINIEKIDVFGLIDKGLAVPLT